MLKEILNDPGVMIALSPIAIIVTAFLGYLAADLRYKLQKYQSSRRK